MARRVNPREIIRQIPIGFHQRQHDFLYKYEEIKISEKCREWLDEMIRGSNIDYLSKEEKATLCPECEKPWNSEYHVGDQCVNLDEDQEVKGLK